MWATTSWAQPLADIALSREVLRGERRVGEGKEKERERERERECIRPTMAEIVWLIQLCDVRRGAGISSLELKR